MDALFHKGHVVAMDEKGSIFSWSMEHDIDGLFPERISPPIFLDIERSTEEVYCLAKSSADDLLLICLYGHSRVPYKHPFYRALVSEYERFLKPDTMSIQNLDEMGSTWSQIHKNRGGATLFLGLNYPFYGAWDGMKPNGLY